MNLLLLLINLFLAYTQPGSSDAESCQIYSLVYTPTQSTPKIFHEYSFPRIAALNNAGKRNAARLLLWKSWNRLFCGYPPIWEIPDSSCYPSRVEGDVPSQNPNESWEKEYRAYAKTIDFMGLLIAKQSSVCLNILNMFLMHHYSDGAPDHIDGKTSCSLLQTPAYVGNNYRVMGPVKIFSKENLPRVDFFRESHKLVPASSEEPDYLASKAADTNVWEPPSSCFCNQYFWNGSLH